MLLYYCHYYCCCYCIVVVVVYHYEWYMIVRLVLGQVYALNQNGTWRSHPK